ncbi:hypothetical protein Pcac1_g19077 [Phytophthora cactorum]|nr:hypothetical protein Pcac1_g19077 [Phytophthora cactorum]
MLSLLARVPQPAAATDLSHNTRHRQQLDLSSFHARGMDMKTHSGDLGGLNDASDAPQRAGHACEAKRQKQSPTVGLEPTTTRLRVLRSTD